MLKKKDKTNFKEISKRIFNSWRILVIALFIFIITLICLNYHLMKTSRTYMFNGSSKFIEIKNGVISTNYSINLFEGSDISYANKVDYNVTKYKIGYYVKINGKYKKFAVIENKDNDGLSLKGLITEYANYNIKEPAQNKNYFSKSNIIAFNNNLYFKIDATTINGEVINDIIKINVTKLSR